MNRREFSKLMVAPAVVRAAKPLNVFWILAEDMGPQLGCYGYPLVRTPNIDRLAAEGVRFTRAFTTAPVCSASRSALHTGMYQTAIGCHHHRSHRNDGYRLPEGVRLITHRLREHGYWTANIKTGIEGITGAGKMDFNFTAERPFDSTDWRERPADRPFFAEINFNEAHKGIAFKEARQQNNLVDPDRVPLPPYYPDHPVVRNEFANYLDAINLLDTKIGVVLKMLDDTGLAENTALSYIGDNGRCLIRGKQWLYDAGVHVPMIVRWPGVLKPATVREDPVNTLDMAATSLHLAGIELPQNLHGQVMLGTGAKQRDWVFCARDRCDETLERIRSVHTRDYNYIRNFMPERPYTQPNKYIEGSYPTLRIMKELHAAGKLNAAQSLFMAERKPDEELYDLLADPHEIRNLAGSPLHQHIVRELRSKLDRWIEDTQDRGRIPEKPEEVSQ